MRERSDLEARLSAFESARLNFENARDFWLLSKEEGDSASLKDAETDLRAAHAAASRARLQAFLSEEIDRNGCFIEIKSGAGGTESQDWAAMLLRMYSRFLEKREYKFELLEENAGEEAGVKSATLRADAPYAYGWLKLESGVHRLVRISPFDSQSRRHTSFASVSVTPDLGDDIDIDIEEKDLRIDTYRASGAGGQHVNRTDSAVRVTHLPTGIVAQCQNDRSQHKNKAAALKMLKSRLYDIELQKREDETRKNRDAKGHNGWGNQIRSYVLHPYQMIKDLRFGAETSRTQAALDGDIDMFLEGALAAWQSAD